MQPSVPIPMGDVLGAVWSIQHGYAEGLIEVWDIAGVGGDRLVRRVWFWAERRARGGRYRVQHDDSTPTIVCDGKNTVTVSHRKREVDRAPGVHPMPRMPGWLIQPRTAMIWGRDEDWKIVTDVNAQVVNGLARIPLTGADAERGLGYADVAWPKGHLQRLVLGDRRYELVDFRDVAPEDTESLFRTDLVVPRRLTGHISRPTRPGDYAFVSHSPDP